MDRQVQPGALLRNVLMTDAVVSGLVLLLLILGAEAVAGITGLPVMALRVVGIALIPWVALLLWAQTRRSVAPAAVWTVIGLNALGAMVCLALAFAANIGLSASATVFIAVNGVGALLLAQAQFVGLRRSSVSAG